MRAETGRGGVWAGVLLAAALAGCSNTAQEREATSAIARQPQPPPAAKAMPSASPRVIAHAGPIPKGGGTYKIGAPYRIGTIWYFPREEPSYDRTGIASWYGADFHGRKTANGEIFDMGAITAAHPTLPIPSLAHVTNLDNGRTLLVRINDRGPYAHGRVLDASREVARLLGFEAKGTVRVRVRYAGRAPLSGDDSAERRFLAAQPWYRQGPAMASPGWGRGTPWLQPGALAHAQPLQAPQAARPANPAPAAGPQRRIYIQAATFRRHDNAMRLKERVAAIGPAQIETLPSAGEPSWRVRLGPYHDPAAAQQAMAQLDAAGISGGVLVMQ